MTKFADWIERQLSSEVAFVKCQKFSQTFGNSFPRKHLVLTKWVEIRVFEPILVKDLINKFGDLNLLIEKVSMPSL